MNTRSTATIALTALVTAAGAASADTLVYDQAVAGFGGDQFDINSPDVPSALNMSDVTLTASQSAGVTTLGMSTAADITGSGYQTFIIDTDGNGSADVEVGYEDGTIFTQTRDGMGAFNSGNYADGLGWTGKDVGSLVAGSITFSSSSLSPTGFTLTTSDLGADALVAGFGIYSDQGLEGTFTIDGDPVNFSGSGENIIFAEGDYFGDEFVSANAPFIAVPAPGSVALLAMGTLVGVRRRR